MEQYAAQKLAKELIEKHLSNTPYKFKWNNRRRSAGLCSYRRKTIELSLPLTILSKVEDVTDTILHEIAHALAGSKAGHGWEWKRIARSIGCNGERCYNEGNKESTYEAYKQVAKFVATCSCGYKSFINRMPKRSYACTECCNKHNFGRYSEKYKLVFVPNV